MTTSTLSAIASGSAVNVATDALVAVRSGTTDVLVTLPASAANTTSTSHQFFTAYNSTTGAFTKAQPASSDLSDASNVVLKNQANTMTSGIQYLNGATIEEAVFSNGNSGTSLALNLDNGNLQSVTITGAVAMTLTAPTHPGKFTLIVTQDGTGHVYSIAGVKFPGGTAPTYSTAASKIDVFSLIWDSTNWYGMAGIAFS